MGCGLGGRSGPSGHEHESTSNNTLAAPTAVSWSLFVASIFRSKTNNERQSIFDPIHFFSISDINVLARGENPLNNLRASQKEIFAKSFSFPVASYAFRERSSLKRASEQRDAN
jgi:hypothetical protein